MSEAPAKAWQPFTFGGVARFGHDWLGRLLLACFVVSIFTAAVVVLTASRAWAPVVAEAIRKTPNRAEIRGGHLTSPQSLRLAENAYLSLWIQGPEPTPPVSGSDIVISLESDRIRLRSIFGHAFLAYRPEWTIPLNPTDLEPKWGAWRPALYAYIFVGTILNLFMSWIGLGIIYAIPAWLLAFLTNRKLTPWGAGKLCVAALMPAAVLLTVAIAIYALGQIRLIELIATWALHFLIGWIFIIGAIFALPKRVHTIENPFQESDAAVAEAEDTPPENPFAKR